MGPWQWESRSGRVEARDGSLEVPSHRILVACSTLQVTIESIRDIEDTLDVFHAERLLVVNGQGLGSADCVLDLHTKALAFFKNTCGEDIPVGHSSCVWQEHHNRIP